MQKLETGVMAQLWHAILTRMNMTSKMLQSSTLDINNAVALLSSLKEFIEALRAQFDVFEERGKTLASMKTFQSKRKCAIIRGDVLTGDVEFTDRERFKVESFLVVIDKLTAAMTSRIDAYAEVCRLFGFLSRLDEVGDDELRRSSETLVRTYSHDVEATLPDEIAQFACMLRIEEIQRECYSDRSASKELGMLRLISKRALAQTFPNVEIVLRLYLCMMVCNCSGERTFSHMKLIKSALRSTIGQQRLNWQALMSIDVLRKIDFASVIDEFARRKARKVIT